MEGPGFKRTVIDQCVYVQKFPNGNFVMLLLYVDDMLIVGQDAIMIHKLKEELFKSFNIKDLGLAQQIIIERPRRYGCHRRSMLNGCLKSST